MPLRRLMTKGLYNARDLGGFPTEDGYATRFGVFVRSEAPCDLPEEDLAYLRNYGVTASIDFRSTGEVTSRPSDLELIMPYYHRSLFNEAAIHKRDGGKRPPAPGHIDWGKEYIFMAEQSKEWAQNVLQIAADNDGALLYHCTTGKDRTGLMTCYLLSIAGVSVEDIVADYAVSQIYLEPVVYSRMRREMQEAGMGGMDDGFFSTRPANMYTLISYLTDKSGGVVPYLRDIGVSDQVIRKLRDKMLTTV